MWSMILAKVLPMTGVVGAFAIFLGFAAWFVGTVSILCGMEALSATLHAVRLQWVEAQSKYAEFAGHMFTPFKFATLLEEDEGLAEFRG